jgi:hypothetical protein
MVEQYILDSFQTMWGPFPEPVMLIHKSREILAVNDFARSLGIPTGAKCFNLNPEVGPGENHCRECQANLALKKGETVSTLSEMAGLPVIGYWMPLQEVPDVYVHFGVGTAESLKASMKAAAPAPDLVNL